MQFADYGEKAIEAGADVDEIMALPVREEIGRAKYIQEDEVKESFEAISKNIIEQMAELGLEGELEHA